jgi:signal transduction histidine kinase
MIINPLLCPGEIPSFWGIFDFSVAPYLLYYSYIPTIILSLLVGFLVLVKDNYSLKSRMFFFLILSFVLWVVNIMFEWLASYIVLLMFSWQIIILFEIPIFIFAVLFTYTFLNKTRQLPYSYKIGSLLLYILAILIVPTSYNMGNFDISVCEGSYGSAWNFIYGFEILSTLFIVYLCLKQYFSKYAKLPRKQILYYAVGMFCFLSLFIFSNVFAGISDNYQINFLGPLGMTLFLGFLTYLIVRYHTFNIKVIGAQALIIALVILIAATFLVNDPFYSEVIIAITLVLVIGLGYSLTQSVKKEVNQREEIERLAQDLAEANEKLKELDQLKSEFLSLATHQIRSPLTAIKGYSSMLLEGDFGVLPQKAMDSVQTIMKSCQNLINVVGDFLNISRIEQGRMIYEKSIFEMRELVKEVVNELKPNIQNAGLSLELEIPDDMNIKVNADRGKIKQAIGNIIDNAIKYTIHGSIKISVFLDKEKIKVAVKDSGVGIDPSEMNKLFTKFSRTKDASKTNITGTGLGLYIAKKMTEAQNGDIKVESEGVGKGTTFTIELPVYKVS